MLPIISSSKRKSARLAYAIIMMIAFIPMASLGSAASPQPQAPQSPNSTCPPGGQCFADVTSASSFYEFVNRIYQQDLVTGYACGGPGEPCDAENRPYYRPGSTVTRQQMAKFIDNARRLSEIHMQVSSGAAPIYARNDTGSAIGAYSTSGQALIAQSSTQSAIYAQSGNVPVISAFSTSGADGIGVYGTAATGLKGSGETGVAGTGSNLGMWGTSTSGKGVVGSSQSNTGTEGISTSYIGAYGRGAVAGVQGDSDTGVGVQGFGDGDAAVYGSTNTGKAIRGFSASGNWAGYFEGNVSVTGNISKGGGSFKIDHPLDPTNKYLYHSFVESPDMMNVYNGNVTTDGMGKATIQLPDWFSALNRDFRYQLTTIGQHADAWIAGEVKDNQFAIETDKPNVKVSWQITGIRQDPYANTHRIPVEEDKPADEQGKYLHPTEWGQPASSGIDYEDHQRMQKQTQQEEVR